MHEAAKLVMAFLKSDIDSVAIMYAASFFLG